MTTPEGKVELVERKVGSQWLITSPQIGGLSVAHKDLETARRGVPGAIAMLKRMTERYAAQREERVRQTAD